MSRFTPFMEKLTSRQGSKLSAIEMAVWVVGKDVVVWCKENHCNLREQLAKYTLRDSTHDLDAGLLNQPVDCSQAVAYAWLVH